MSDNMKVCYFGSYAPFYPRHRIIIKKYFSQKDFDIIFVGEASNYVQPLAILLKKITRTPLVFDTYVSLYDTNQDRGVHQNPLLSRLFYNIDKYNCHFSDMVLQDTNQNINYFHEIFHIPKNKFRRLLIGAEDDLFYPQTVTDSDFNFNSDFNSGLNKTPEEKFKILFYGTYIPLHGIQYIIKAAQILESENIEFKLIGKGQTFPEIKNLKEELNLSNVEFIEQYG